jgi:hypothetical protein
MLKTNVSLADVKEWLSKGFECLPVGIDSLIINILILYEYIKMFYCINTLI